MRGPDLPHRRYSMPETVMRKFRLGQSSSSSSESGSRRGMGNRPRRQAPKKKACVKPQYRVNRSCQTSPQVKCNSDSQCLSSDQVLVQSSPSLVRQRANSFPDISSSEEGKVYKSLRPISANDRCGTPSPSQVSCYGPPGHRCGLCSNTWSVTSSDYTLSQTVSDRTTSTQDSTLSVQSSSPSTMTPTSFNSEKARILENSIFAPLGNFVAVHTECLLIRPIQVLDTSDNWQLGFTPDDAETRLAMMPQSVGTNTEDDIEAITSGRRDRSTSIGTWPQPDYEPTPQLMIDKETITNGFGETESSDTDHLTVKEVSVNTNGFDGENDLKKTIGTQVIESNFEEEAEGCASIGCQTNEFVIPHIQILQSSMDVAVPEKQDKPKRPKHSRERQRPREEKYQQTECILKSSKSFPPFALCYPKQSKSLDADLACSGSNYKDITEANSVIARFSAVPRSNSMLVNTSSVDYTSDSDLSLTDSLEDHEERQEGWGLSRHDNRLVRGEVTIEADPRSLKRYPKNGEAYAYFLSITGEEDMIKHYPIPEWLSSRLKRREEEIKKLFEVKLNKNTIFYKRKKKTVKRLENYESSSNSKENKKKLKSVKFECKNGEEQSSSSRKVADKAEQTKSSSKSNENKPIHVQSSKQKLEDDEKNSKPPAIEGTLTVLNPQIKSENNFVHISEIIKIEMSNKLKTVITKEKQINLNNDAFLQDGRGIQTSEIINNEDADNSQKIIMKTNVGQVQIEVPSVIESQPFKTKAIEGNVETEVVPAAKVFSKSETSGYSFKDFRPLFESKADDKTVAQVLIDAMEENSVSDDNGTQVIKTESKAVDTADSPFTANQQQQTGESTEESEEEKKTEFSERSCNTEYPYLSEFIQTTESFLESNLLAEPSSKDIGTSDSENSPTPIVTTDEKAINTNSFSVSTLVQTQESFLEDDKHFIEAPYSKDVYTDTYEEDLTADKSCNTMNPLVTSSMQTEGAANEVKPLVPGEGKKVQFNKKVSLNTERSSKTKKDTSVLFCKKTGQALGDKSPQVLELNVPPCSCHMCTLHKHTLAAAADKQKGQQQVSNTSKNRLQTKKTVTEKKEEQKSNKFQGGRRSAKFLRKFEAIPEEKSSTESVTEEKIFPLDLTKKSLSSVGTMTLCERPPPRNAFVETAENETQIDSITIEEKRIAKKSNIVIGRFRPLTDDDLKKENRRESPILGEGLELVRQYKGRAALAATQVEGHEELMTLSKGWINFYLLKDSQDCSDNEEYHSRCNDGHALLSNGTLSKTPIGTKIAEERFKQYTVEIHATPEPVQQSTKGLVLPNLPQRETIKKHRGHKHNPSNVSLPEIHSSSSSSTPENTNEKLSQKDQTRYQQQLPEVVSSRKKSSRREFNSMREQVTAIEKLSKSGVERDLETGAENSIATKAVEVARSEHSVSSITSSTVILSESPSPQQFQLTEKKSHQKRQTFYSQPGGDMGTSWTVTVAGSSGMKNQTPPDVEMKLTFNKQSTNNAQDNNSRERSLMQYNSQHTSHISRSKRQGKMIEEYAHLRNEHHTVQYVPELSFQKGKKSKKERGRNEQQKDDGNFLDSELGPLSARSKLSADGSEGSSDLQVTGLAITPEMKPRVPTQSERDLVRRQRHKFTR